MKTQVLNKETSDKISFISFIIPAFAEAYKMNVQAAYRYLKRYGGLDFLQNIGGRCIRITKYGQYTIFMKFAEIMEDYANETLPRQLHDFLAQYTAEGFFSFDVCVFL